MNEWRQISESSLIDIHLARFLLRLSRLQGEEGNIFSALIERLSAALGDGHSCISLVEQEEILVAGLPVELCLSLESYFAEGRAPLVMYDGKLFFYRYFHYEFRLARQIRALAGMPQQLGECRLLGTLFPEDSDLGAPDLQKEAALLAISSNLAIISGGPGTGKTTTVVKILALLLARSFEKGELLPRIALAAPTGRAAMRLGESITGSIDKLLLPQKIKEAIPQTARTLHRMLGVRQGEGRFVYNHEHPLDYSVVIVDEASMVDLALMSRLVDALPANCRLLLLGDKDQLASVESGAVLADLLVGLPRCGIQLQHSYRFDRNISALAAAVNAGDAAYSWQLLEDSYRDNLSLLSGDWYAWLAKRLSLYMAAVRQLVTSGDEGMRESDVAQIFIVLRSFQILCATRKGTRGVELINAEMIRLLAGMGFSCRGGDGWFPGRPVMVTRNDYALELFNGDIGICLPNAEGDLRIWFERAEGIVEFLPGQLSHYETAFATTVHKSQGAEFAEVVLLLPEKTQRGLSRELIYTGITRAKKRVWLLAEKDVFAMALNCPVIRQSGLQQLLSEDSSSN